MEGGTDVNTETDVMVVAPKTAYIDSIDSANNCVAVKIGDESLTLREMWNVLKTQINPEKFLSISRTANLNLVKAPSSPDPIP